MLTSLHIQEFKGLRDINIPELRKVNLILGGQNVGKTSLLEAIVFVAGDLDNPDNPGSRNRLPFIFRSCEGHGDALRFWQGLLGIQSNPKSVQVQATINARLYAMGGYADQRKSDSFEIFRENIFDGGGQPFAISLTNLRLNIDTLGPVDWMCGSTENGIFYPRGDQVSHPFPTTAKTASDQVALYGRLVIGKKKKTVLQLLQRIDSRVDGIDAVAPDGEHRVYIDLADGYVLPISQLGHGFTRLFELYAGLAVTESKLALIDEIENGIHYSALPTLFQGVRELSESKGVQSIITTHSLECIRSAYEVFEDKLDDFQMIRLERSDDGSTRAVVIADENLRTVMDAGWEIR